jgi:hypothetical protein
MASRSHRQHRSSGVPSLIERLEPRQLLSTYYVSSGGNDHSTGMSVKAAWKSIGRVNQQSLKDGDVVLFQGRHTFHGSIYVAPSEGGTLNHRVTFSSFGKGRATISSGTRNGIDVAQTAGVTITDLNFVGSKNGLSNGIYVHTERKNNRRAGLTIRNVDIKNYGGRGIFIAMMAPGAGLDNVNISYATLHDNTTAGFKSTAHDPKSNRKWLIDHVQAWNNPGRRGTSNGVTGSGIFVDAGQDVTIQYSIAHDNGRDGLQPVGIWAARSDRVVMQHNETYNNHSRAISDGGGFDFDWDVTNSVMQYNYSHGNDGPGYLLYAGTHHSAGNIIRYNVTVNDGRRNGKGGIQIGGNVNGADIYNNVVYFKNNGQSLSAAFIAHDYGSNGLVPRNISVRNNIFQTTGGAKLVSLQGSVSQKTSNFKFNANAYNSSGAAFRIDWGSSDYSSLNAWRKGKGQEMWSGVATGFQGDPRLRSPGWSGTVGNADLLTARLRPYTLARSSPIINKGVPQISFLQSVFKPVHDFFGRKGLRGGKYEMGIEEVR